MSKSLCCSVFFLYATEFCPFKREDSFFFLFLTSSTLRFIVTVCRCFSVAFRGGCLTQFHTCETRLERDIIENVYLMQTRHFREWEAVFQKANSQFPQSNSRAQPKRVLPFTPSFCHYASHFILPHLSRRIIFSSNCNLFASSWRRLLFLHRVLQIVYISQRGICVHIIAQKMYFYFYSVVQ